jgi:hypothetical protein
MSAEDWDDQSLTWIRSEHQELCDVISDLKQVIRMPQRTQSQVVTLISRLRELVESHFLHEQQGGYLGDLAVKVPRYRAEAAALMQQHEALLEEADKLSLLVHSGVESPAWWVRVESDLQKFSTRLINHERAEDRLVHDAQGTDGRPPL